MRFQEFEYSKKDGAKSSYKLLVLTEDKEYIKGINLLSLNEEEVKELLLLQQDYEVKLKPFMKNYRQFIKENIITE